jgi:hypothetical protein
MIVEMVNLVISGGSFSYQTLEYLKILFPVKTAVGDKVDYAKHCVLDR